MRLGTHVLSMPHNLVTPLATLPGTVLEIFTVNLIRAKTMLLHGGRTEGGDRREGGGEREREGGGDNLTLF